MSEDRSFKAFLPRGPQVYVRCHRCGQLVGEVVIYTDGTHYMPPLRGCSKHGPMRHPAARAVGGAVRKARRTGGPIPLRVDPTS